MPKYKLRHPPIVEAVQWFPDMNLPNVVSNLDSRGEAYGVVMLGTGYTFCHAGDWIIQHRYSYSVMSDKAFRAEYELLEKP